VTRRLTVRHERFPIRGSFTISRGSRTHADVVVVELEEAGRIGRGECVPYPRYGESTESVIELIQGQAGAIATGMDRQALQAALPAGAARNAVDCALWDLEARLAGTPVWRRAGLPEPQPLTTAFTISLGTPDAMAEAARAAADRPLLKIKLGGEGDVERMRAVRAAAPQARLIVDANEAWSLELLEPYLAAMVEFGVEMVEQPLPAGHDAILARTRRPVPVGADESVHASDGLEALAERYDVVNLKLDKTGGLTEAIRFAERAGQLGLGLMVGCMVGTSLSMAPAMLVAQEARFVDLDGPLLLAQDRSPALTYEGSRVLPPAAVLWGG
jgi:L-Ala-D/L-Glu epimerase